MIIQRALAAKNLGHAQTGLLVGGILKYLMAIMIVIPGIALFAYDQSLISEPDMAFPFVVKNYIPIGLKGIILCGLFASVMSTVDSTYNSIATIWSIDIYSTLINKKASSKEKVNAGKSSIILSLISGLTMGMISFAGIVLIAGQPSLSGQLYAILLTAVRYVFYHWANDQCGPF